MEFGEIMQEKYEKIVDKLKADGRINNIEHSIAMDLVFDFTENNSLISKENNIIEEYFETIDGFENKLHEAYSEIKKYNPGLEEMSESDISNNSMSWAIEYLEE